MKKLLIVLYFFTISALFLYSFTQVDLSLPIPSIPFIGDVQEVFRYIGYFNRPLSTAIYLTILLAMFTLYILAIRMELQKKLSKKLVWSIIIMTAIVLLFSYNAFSYDLFNYIFDAKIVTFYHANPYIHRALDFPGDPMLSFMRWTHRVYPYGPIWLAMTVPLSYLGANGFIITFFLFKLLMSASFLGTVYMIGKVFKKYSEKDEVFGLIFFGLNPLIIIESLVSAHIDIVMMFFAVASIYYLLQKNHLTAWIFLLTSIGIKFATLFLLPVFIIKSFLEKKSKFSWHQMFYLATISMSLAIVAASVQSGNFQPWYLFYFFTFATFVSKRPVIFIASFIGSFVGLLNYVPYILLGVWDKNLPEYVSQINISGLAIIVILSVLYIFTHPKKVS